MVGSSTTSADRARIPLTAGGPRHRCEGVNGHDRHNEQSRPPRLSDKKPAGADGVGTSRSRLRDSAAKPSRPPRDVGPSPAITEINNALTAAALRTPAASADYRLGPEDVLQITLFNIPQGEAGVTPRQTEVRVSQEGKITLPTAGRRRGGGVDHFRPRAVAAGTL